MFLQFFQIFQLYQDSISQHRLKELKKWKTRAYQNNHRCWEKTVTAYRKNSAGNPVIQNNSADSFFCSAASLIFRCYYKTVFPVRNDIPGIIPTVPGNSVFQFFPVIFTDNFSAKICHLACPQFLSA